MTAYAWNEYRAVFWRWLFGQPRPNVLDSPGGCAQLFAALRAVPVMDEDE